MERIFCIGLSRTGTTSIAYALEEFGYKSSALPLNFRHQNKLVALKVWINRLCMFLSKRLLSKRLVLFKKTYSRKNKLILNMKGYEHFNVLSDTPTALLFRELDKKYPGSKFILTTRDQEDWLKSCERHFQPKFTGGLFDQLNYEIYGTHVFDRDKFIQAYARHIQQVKGYFANRSADLLCIDVCAGEGFEKIAPFLEKPIPRKGFPSMNSNRPRKLQLESRVNHIKKSND